MYRIANAPHAPIEQARADLPLGCRGIVDKSLEKDPNKRYQRGSEMAADIRALLAMETTAGA